MKGFCGKMSFSANRIKMSETQELFIRILKGSLWRKDFSEELDFQEFKEILRCANSQTVLGLVFNQLKDAKIDGGDDKMPIYEAIGSLEAIKQQNKFTNKELAQFAAICENKGIEYIVVKGQTMSCLYPCPELRQAGDIDFLARKSKCFSDIFCGINLPMKMAEKEFAFEWHNIIYELHTSLVSFGVRKHRHMWEQLMEEEWKQEHYVGIEGSKVRTLSPTINAVYVFIHLFFHFIRAGVSLRQFCDWAMLLHYNKENIDKCRLNGILDSLGMTAGYKAFGSILVDVLGLPEDEFPVEINTEDRRWKDAILNEIFKGGNFGRENHQMRSVLGYKAETLLLMVKKSYQFRKLASSELIMMIPKQIYINLRLLCV